MGQTRTEKITQRYAVDLEANQMIRSGQTVWIQPDHVLTHDNTAAVIPKFNDLGLMHIYNPNQPVIALDHNIQDRTKKNLSKYELIQSFAETKGLTFFPAGRGIGHQIMVEEGFAFAGNFCVASDSHANMYGGIGCLGTPIVRSDAAGIWATGKMWWTVPPVINVVMTGRLRPNVSGKDVILSLIAQVGHKAVLNCALEFSGEGIRSLSIDDRLSIANMTTEWGALSGLFPTDQILIDWIIKQQNMYPENCRFSSERISDLNLEKLDADGDAIYEKTITIDLSTVSTSVTGANDLSTTIANQEKIYIDKAYLISCVNSRTSDLLIAAEILAERRIHPNVDFYLSPSSSQVQDELVKTGHWQILIDAGAKELPSGCGPCIGLGEGLLKPGEIAISASNRNFPGRMGHKDSIVYLASPALVAKSALNGFISSSEIEKPVSVEIINHHFAIIDFYGHEKSSNDKVLSGSILFCPTDNITTDGIFPSWCTYNESLTKKDMGKLAMINYDESFRTIAKEGDILVAGHNFGSGSSREQAVTALKAKGIQTIVAASFSATFKRNALNNGFGLIESKEVYKYLKSIIKNGAPTLRPGFNLTLNFSKGTISVDDIDKQYTFKNWNSLEKELISINGLNNYIRNDINEY